MAIPSGNHLIIGNVVGVKYTQNAYGLATEYLAARYREQCVEFPRTVEIPLALYVRRNRPFVIQNWRNLARDYHLYTWDVPSRVA